MKKVCAGWEDEGASRESAIGVAVRGKRYKQANASLCVENLRKKHQQQREIINVSTWHAREREWTARCERRWGPTRLEPNTAKNR
jgi:hypothetical protein